MKSVSKMMKLNSGINGNCLIDSEFFVLYWMRGNLHFDEIPWNKATILLRKQKHFFSNSIFDNHVSCGLRQFYKQERYKQPRLTDFNGNYISIKMNIIKFRHYFEWLWVLCANNVNLCVWHRTFAPDPLHILCTCILWTRVAASFSNF